MARALWQGQVIAESGRYETVEGNVYFPPGTVNLAFLTRSPTTTVCGWKGTAHYYSIEVEGARNADAAWYYPDPKPAAENIRDHIAFWRGVTVET